MLSRILAGAAFVLLSVTSAGATPSLEAYGQLQSLDNFTISPDGKNIAYVTNVKGKRTVLINSLTEGKVIGGISVEDKQKLRDVSWGDSDHLLISLSTTRTAVGTTGSRGEYYLTQSYSISRKSADVLLAHGDYQMNITLSQPTPRAVDGKPVVFVEGITFVNQSSIIALFLADLTSGRLNHIVEKGSSAHGTDWILDEAGNIAARTEYNDDTKLWSLKIKHGPGYTLAYSEVAPIDTPSTYGITPDGKSIVIVTQKVGQFTPRQFSLADNSVQTPIDVDGTENRVITDPKTHRMIGTMRMGGTAAVYKFFDPADQAAWDGIAHAFPGENVGLQSWSDDRKQVVVRVDGKRDGAGFYLIDLTSHKASYLGAAYAGIEIADQAEVKFITYAAADGTKIPAYLTLPNGKDPKNLPLILLPHGGPASRDTPEFDWLSQALASRGYAVLQPEFRGSDGFGWAHLSAGFGQWGRKMQTDLSDGVRYLAGQGTIDPKRVCIFGWSYGGYAALAGATMDKGVYRCAADMAGVSDPHNMMRWIRERQQDPDTIAQRYWNRFMGTENYDDPKLNEVSPLHRASEANIPILIVHGKDDLVVPIDQSEAMEAALRAAGKPVTFVKLDSEDHWASRPETRTKMLQTVVQFLEANNPPN